MEVSIEISAVNGTMPLPDTGLLWVNELTDTFLYMCRAFFRQALRLEAAIYFSHRKQKFGERRDGGIVQRRPSAR
jgi:hypothetical protein